MERTTKELARHIPKPKNVNFTPEQIEIVFNEIIDQLSYGTDLTKVLSNNSNYPNPATFYKWLNNSADRKQMYMCAQEVRAHVLFENLLTTATGDKDNDSVVMVQRDRLMTDVMKFYIAKVLPKVYGDKIDVTSDGKAVVMLNLGTGIAPSEPTTEEGNYIDVTNE